MKKSLFLLILITTLVSCGGDNQTVDAVINSGDMTAIKAKRAEMNKQQRELKAEIDKLNQYIETHERKERPALVTAEVIKDTIFKHYVEVQGNVETDQNVVLNAEYSGVLTNIYVKEGQRVSKGQRLAKIDDGGLSSQVAQQEAQMALAQTTFERQQRLWEQKIGSEIQYLQAKTNYESAKNVTNQLRAQLAKTIITAPFSGVVDEIISDQGQVVVPGQTPIIRLVNLSNMYVKASIPETYLKNITKGTQVKVKLASINEEFTGKVRQVSNYINPNNRSFDIQVEIPNKDGLVKPNLIATVKVNDYSAENAITVPENILQENAAGETIAYLYQPVNDSVGIAKRVLLETGLSYENHTEVKSGIKKGDTIIKEGAKTLRDGQKVTIKN
ncbi:efflux RND transporter periplasmic adaptor subunit [Aequorivita vladivostokensis]|uniref:RND transporter n=1 Tax=Aequorivita vladivostokensis TaxID=171194 RepID=A0ABR5DLP0_9FLAO|nr:efflux RND transporter periplasmic adaptor subunit [Aequorivita vladivostokensis]MAB57976.1 efflux RND transporter periplasmic adaptor subunit [Aequorivita sp.]KJJ39692.1 RND transporter [Aequorivita vladivostokensis]MBF32111.1 efflux RND transporter periplasmic adaptor subunit [Aequorivita sp.]MDX1783056.1 efflux RND transporter periplasmic adaptor subunit [Aequorivita vladivostokensis]HAV53429.1 efflux RND transporter periplasmic adaptor subunit [Aequorivita sp.]|tara:strand:+ start:29084 stop:30244 length:1161 start_codon:yes stop_codon:yes gene_type:complete